MNTFSLDFCTALSACPGGVTKIESWLSDSSGEPTCADRPDLRPPRVVLTYISRCAQGGCSRSACQLRPSREAGARHGEGLALANLGSTLRELGRLEEAVTAHQDAAAIFPETGKRHGEGMALADLEGARITQQELTSTSASLER